jgi:5-methylthioadenosine/S-adenosylhomocysteine deaminase
VIPIDLVVMGTIVTMDRDDRLVSDGAVAVQGTRIVAVGAAPAIRSQYSASRTIGGHDHVVIPGLIDCHNHLAQSLVRDRGFEDLPGIYRLYIPAEQAMTDGEVAVAARVGIAQLLRSGTTTVAETTATMTHEPVIAQAVMESGIRCAMARGQGDRKSHLAGSYAQVAEKSHFIDDAARLRADLEASEVFLKKWQTAGQGRLKPWLHAGSIATASDRRFLELNALAARYDTGVMVHINRDREEIELSMALFGERPIEHLQSIGALSSNLLAIHAMLCTDREIRMLANAAVKVAHAPLACVDLLSAATKVVTMQVAGVVIGLATDTISYDMFRVLGHAHAMHNQATGLALYDPIAFTTRTALAMATRDAARALLWDDNIGSIEVGKCADLAVLRTNKLRLAPYDDLVGALVRHAVSEDVDTVIVDGRVVVEGGMVLALDERKLLDDAARTYAKLGRELKPRRYRSSPPSVT